MKVTSDQTGFSFLDLILLIQASVDRLTPNFCNKNPPDWYSDIVGTVKVTLTNTTTCSVTETLGVTRTMTVTMRLTSKEERIVTVTSRLTVKGRETEKETLNLTLRRQ